MRAEPKFIGIFMVFLVVVGVGHLLTQVYFYGSGIEGFLEGGISGLAVQEEEDDGPWLDISLSSMILFAEWALILMGIVFVYVRHKVDLKKECHDLEILKRQKHFSKGTELDNFYELLQQVKHFRLAAAAQVFDVDDEVIEDWAKTLEGQRFATLTYPRIGGPKIVLKEKIQVVEKKLDQGKKVVEKNEELLKNEKVVEKKKLKKVKKVSKKEEKKK